MLTVPSHGDGFGGSLLQSWQCLPTAADGPASPTTPLYIGGELVGWSGPSLHASASAPNLTSLDGTAGTIPVTFSAPHLPIGMPCTPAAAALKHSAPQPATQFVPVPSTDGLPASPVSALAMQHMSVAASPTTSAVTPTLAAGVPRVASVHSFQQGLPASVPNTSLNAAGGSSNSLSTQSGMTSAGGVSGEGTADDTQQQGQASTNGSAGRRSSESVRRSRSRSDMAELPPNYNVPHVEFLTPPHLRKGRGGRQPAADPRTDPGMDPKRARRILANRLSAAKSKLKQKNATEAERQRVEMLALQREQLNVELAGTTAACQARQREQAQLAAQVQALDQHLASQAQMLLTAPASASSGPPAAASFAPSAYVSPSVAQRFDMPTLVSVTQQPAQPMERPVVNFALPPIDFLAA